MIEPTPTADTAPTPSNPHILRSEIKKINMVYDSCVTKKIRVVRAQSSASEMQVANVALCDFPFHEIFE